MLTDIQTRKMPGGEFLEAALAAERWISSRSTPSRHGGLIWPDAATPASSARCLDLYSGSAGIVLYLLELYYATSDESVFAYARGGGEELLAEFPSVRESGLYTGLAGIAFALWQLGQAGAGARFLLGARACVELLLSRLEEGGGDSARHAPTGSCDQPDSMQDVFSGSAGVGLFLLWWARETGAERAHAGAQAIADRLLGTAHCSSRGLDWPAAGGEYGALNFAHGSAGIVFFLAKLANEVPRAATLAGALEGARCLVSHAKTGEGVFLLPHTQRPLSREGADTPGPSIYPMNWCHGPAGTGLTWYQLYVATYDNAWLQAFEGCSRAFFPASRRLAGLSSEPYSAYSVCWCHGLAGNATFLLTAHRVTSDESFRQLGDTMIRECLAHALPDSGGLMWRQLGLYKIAGSARMVALPRTGFGVGAAGIGLCLLRFHGYESNTPPRIVLPDAV
ncbi:MAG: lanthionine synthetase LanC family protein [Gammaproteobacteria bacterium]